MSLIPLILSWILTPILIEFLYARQSGRLLEPVSLELPISAKPTRVSARISPHLPD